MKEEPTDMALETPAAAPAAAERTTPALTPARVSSAAPGAVAAAARDDVKLAIRDLNLYYGSFRAVRDVTMEIAANQITAIIGPSGCGKSTFLRSINRMHELTRNATVKGEIILDGTNIYAPEVDAVDLRRFVGMVFQRPNPFPTMSIYDNVVAGLRLGGGAKKGEYDEIVERCLTSAGLWGEVKDKLKQGGTSLSGGQQQRLCIARALAVDPEVILMDEPASALDPVATLRIEELMLELRGSYTIVIVTHNMQQASRVSDFTAFFSMDEDRSGYVVEMDRTTQIFTNPREQLTEDYVSGRFG
jgi:phosphate transport system ATP-binding protein